MTKETKENLLLLKHLLEHYRPKFTDMLVQCPKICFLIN